VDKVGAAGELGRSPPIFTSLAAFVAAIDVVGCIVLAIEKCVGRTIKT